MAPCVQQLHGLHLVRDGAALRAHLHHALVLARGRDHLAALRKCCGRRASPRRRPCRPGRPRWWPARASDWAAEAKRRRYPWTRTAPAYRRIPWARSPSAFWTRAIGPLAGGLVDVANGGDAAVGIERCVEADVVVAAPAQADDADIDAVVGAENGKLGGGDGRRSRLRELPSAGVLFHE